MPDVVDSSSGVGHTRSSASRSVWSCSWPMLVEVGEVINWKIEKDLIDRIRITGSLGMKFKKKYKKNIFDL